MKKSDPLQAFENPEFILRAREARPIRILSEYIEPEKRFHEYNIEHTVVFFGSARTLPDSGETSAQYQAAMEFARRLANLSNELEQLTGSPLYVCTGGGPGIMEAANRGAAQAGCRTLGLNIELPFEQEPNPYITPELCFKFHYFFMRKLWFLYHAKALVVFPGGYGTLDELFEALTLVQTRKLEKLNIPILLYGRAFWEKAVNFPYLVECGFISQEDLDLFYIFDDLDEGINYLRPRLIEIMQNINHYLDMKFPI